MDGLGRIRRLKLDHYFRTGNVATYEKDGVKLETEIHKRDECTLKPFMLLRITKGPDVAFGLKSYIKPEVKNVNVPWVDALGPDVVKTIDHVISLTKHVTAVVADKAVGDVQKIHQDITEMMKTCDNTRQDLFTIKVQLANLRADDNSTSVLLHKPLLRLFSAISGLLILDLSNAYWQERQGITLLESAVETCSECLHVLNLVNYFRSGVTLLQNVKFFQIMQRFRQLTTVSINYSYLSDQLILILSKNSPQLNFISINVSPETPCRHSISADSWRTLTEACPEAKVDVAFDRIVNSEVIDKILVPSMPACFVEIIDADMRQWEKSAISSVLTKIIDRYNGMLEELILHARPYPRENLDELVLDLMTTCKKLYRLDVFSRMRAAALKLVCELGVSRRTSVRKLHIRLLGPTRHDKEQMKRLNKEYAQTLRKRILKYSFCAQADGTADDAV